MANAAPQLQEAYDLIESGDLQSARQLLDDIRPDNENNPDFWWVYAHAVENKADGLAAVDRVRQLAPNYPGLSNFSEGNEIISSYPGSSAIQPLQRPPVPSPSTDDVEEYYDDMGEDEFDSVPPSGSGGNNWLIYVGLALVAVVVIILGLIFLTNILSGGGDETPTQVAEVTDSPSPEPIIPTADVEASTEEPTVEPTDTDEPATETPTQEPTDTDEPPTEEPTDTDIPPTATDTDEPPTETPAPVDPIADLYDELEDADVPEDGIVVGETETFGDTYIITTCTQPGPVATQNILAIMDELAAVADDLEEVDGFSFEITDCATDTVRLALGFDSDTAADYWSGEIDATELQQSLQRVN